MDKSRPDYLDNFHDDKEFSKRKALSNKNKDCSSSEIICEVGNFDLKRKNAEGKPVKKRAKKWS